LSYLLFAVASFPFRMGGSDVSQHDSELGKADPGSAETGSYLAECEVRSTRQQRLTDTRAPLELPVVIDGGALRRAVNDSAVMRRQPGVGGGVHRA
jgi:hypothetical protein